MDLPGIVMLLLRLLIVSRRQYLHLHSTETVAYFDLFSLFTCKFVKVDVKGLWLHIHRLFTCYDTNLKACKQIL